MRLKWTSKALDDLARLYEFLAAVNKPAAARTVQSLTDAPTRLLEQPYIGEKFSTIYILRLWHTREDR
ncbi:MAG: type II toxin-antitoxin system RelE/ParE family toxin [Methylobacter sp.]|nr:MAG: type II toxin-antitoxin system RelE/ParE family toxin [Methylobacter sp.]